MNRIEFLKLLKEKVLLFDGGIGTEFYSKGIFINKCFEELNLSNQALVKQTHKNYIDAGSDIISTNTFGANPIKLETHQLQDKVYDINYYGAKLAKEVAKDDVFVAGSIGPLGMQIEPLGKVSFEEAREIFKKQIQPLLDGGVDLLLFETFIYPRTLLQAIKAARDLKPDIPIIAQITIDDDCSTLTGASPELIVKELEKFDADVIGVNCTVGPQTMLQWLEMSRSMTKLPISVMPNAGKPKNIDGRNIYLTSPEYLGEYAKHYIQAGANIIGGCCGTTPEHIKRMRNMVNSVRKSKYKLSNIKENENFLSEIDLIEKSKRSELSSKLYSDKYLKFVELLSPRGVDYSKEISRAEYCKNHGIDVINIPDGPRASARMSAMSLSILIQNLVGIETVLHFVCRDRNVIGMQSDLMGAYALGVKNILAITGDPPKLGNYPDATAVFDVDSIGLTNILNLLNHGLDISGSPIGTSTGFCIGVGANPGAINLNHEIDRLKWKVDAGAEYVITQPVFKMEQFENFLNKIHNLNIPVVAGLWPLVSYRNAEFMNNEVPGIEIPELILKRMKKFEEDKDAATLEGIDIAKEFLLDLIKITKGIQISAPFGRVELVSKVLEDFNV